MPVTVAEPGATPVKLTEQLPDTKLQLAPTVPTAVLDETKLTEPVAVFDAVVVSVTVAVQVETPPMLIEAGLQTTAVEVLSFTTVIVPEVPELPLWDESPLYVPVTVAVPGETPVNAAVQLPDTRAQLAATVPTAVFDDVKVTLPVGVLAGVVVSDTVAVQVETAPMLIDAGRQETTVDVASRTTVIVPEVPELAL